MGHYWESERGFRSRFPPHFACRERKQMKIAGDTENSADQTHLAPCWPIAPRSSDFPNPRSKVGGPSGSKRRGPLVCEAEKKRLRRLATYNAYAVEGKVKASVVRGIRWVKEKCSGLIHLR
ncbi:unnamed protein product [Spirodela intermedia]|uniref:Uncharacterized protein n=1 Tax=Spirodela intermedia TaxID=51605 RepID=A0A7I8KS22_SPIIN|nr:unnamed protein product [Spirodela intermedia]